MTRFAFIVARNYNKYISIKTMFSIFDILFIYFDKCSIHDM